MNVPARSPQYPAHTLRALTPRLASLCVAAALALGCGGDAEEPTHRLTSSGGESAGNPDPRSYPQTITIALEAGTLVVGRSSGTRGPVAISVEADGELVLSGCDWLEAKTAQRGWELGEATYATQGRTERLMGVYPRPLLLGLTRGSNPAIVTCDEEVLLPPQAVVELDAFLTGRTLGPEETFESRTISLHGLTLGFRISNLAPNVVEIDLRVEDASIPLDECVSLIAMAGGRTFELTELGNIGGEDDEDALIGDSPKVNVQILAAAAEAQLIVCDEPWLLDEWAIENLRGLVGSPADDAELVLPELEE